jgi:hypothetical protein
MIHCFSEVVEEPSLESEYRICTNELGNSFCDIRNFLRVHEDILPITRTESELPNQWNNLIRYTNDSHIIDGFATEIIDELICILLIFLNYLLYASWLNTLICDEIFERFFGNITTKEIKTREKYGVWCIIDDE